MKIVTITLMRKGSERFPDKVRKLYKKKPLYQHTVDFALKLGYPYYLFHDYGDDLELPEEKPEVFETRHRSEYFAGSVHRTCEEIKASGIEADIYIFLQVTSPRRSLSDVKRWVREFCGPKFPDAGLSVHIMPDGFYYANQGKPINFNQDDRDDNGCNKKKIWKETGSFYIFKKKQLEEQHIMDSRNKMFFFDKYNIDINEKKDLK